MKQRSMKIEGNKIYELYFQQARAITEAWTQERLAAQKEALDVEGRAQKELALEKERDRQILEEILRENAKIAKRRKLLQENIEKYYEKMKKRQEKILEKRNKKLLERRTAIVKEAIEESKNFVTLDNLEDKITECLESQVNYNFALTPTGDKIYSTSPPGNFGKEWQIPGPVAYEVTQSKPVGGEWDWVFDRTSQWQSKKETPEFIDIFDLREESVYELPGVGRDTGEMLKDADKWQDQSLDDAFLDMLEEKSAYSEKDVAEDDLRKLDTEGFDVIKDKQGVASEEDELWEVLREDAFEGKGDLEDEYDVVKDIEQSMSSDDKYKLDDELVDIFKDEGIEANEVEDDVVLKHTEDHKEKKLSKNKSIDNEFLDMLMADTVVPEEPEKDVEDKVDSDELSDDELEKNNIEKENDQPKDKKSGKIGKGLLDLLNEEDSKGKGS